MISIISIICLLVFIAQSQPPSNQDPCNPIEITGSLPLTYPDASNIGANVPIIPSCGTSTTKATVWYKIKNVRNFTIRTTTTYLNEPDFNYDTKLSIWVIEDCTDTDTWTCIDGNDDCWALFPVCENGCIRSSCVQSGDECYDEIYIQLHGFVNGKCNLPAPDGEHICGHIQNSGPNEVLNCNDADTRCCDGFTCNTKNGKCLKKSLKKSFGLSEASIAVSDGASNGGSGLSETSTAISGGGSDELLNERSSSDEVVYGATFESNINDKTNMNRYNPYNHYGQENNKNSNNLLITNIWAMLSVIIFIVLLLFCVHQRDRKHEIFASSQETQPLEI